MPFHWFGCDDLIGLALTRKKRLSFFFFSVLFCYWQRMWKPHTSILISWLYLPKYSVYEFFYSSFLWGCTWSLIGGNLQPRFQNKKTQGEELKQIHRLQQNHRWIIVHMSIKRAETSLCWQRSIWSELWFFSVVLYGCESWTTKKAERQRINAFEWDQTCQS